MLAPSVTRRLIAEHALPAAVPGRIFTELGASDRVRP
jgi:hypothetical protein